MPKFDTLTTDVRFVIYELLFSQTILSFKYISQEYIDLCDSSDDEINTEVPPDVEDRSKNGSELALTYVNKLVHQETRELWLRYVHFEFAYPRLMVDKVGGLSIRQRSLIRYVRVIPGAFPINLPPDDPPLPTDSRYEQGLEYITEIGVMFDALPGLRLEHLVIDWRVAPQCCWDSLEETLSLIKSSKGWRKLSVFLKNWEYMMPSKSRYISGYSIVIDTNLNDPDARVEVYGGLERAGNFLCITESHHEKFQRQRSDKGFTIVLPSIKEHGNPDFLRREVMFVATHGSNYDYTATSTYLLSYLQPCIAHTLKQSIPEEAMDWNTLVRAEKQYQLSKEETKRQEANP